MPAIYHINAQNDIKIKKWKETEVKKESLPCLQRQSKHAAQDLLKTAIAKKVKAIADFLTTFYRSQNSKLSIANTATEAAASYRYNIRKKLQQQQLNCKYDSHELITFKHLIKHLIIIYKRVH